jgi:hypothetical protein
VVEDERAIQAVHKWRFRPGLQNGEPVRVRPTFEVVFRLERTNRAAALL